MDKIKTYLAGAVDTDDWRHEVVKQCQDLSVEWMSPIYGYNYRTIEKANKRKKVFHLADRWKVDHADIIFAYLRKGSASRFSGTSWECGRADDKDKIVIIVNDMEDDKEKLYELVKRTADVYCTTLDEGINRLREIVEELTFDLTKEEK
jgi:nucleoside 2-deoxyribosyltransferase